MSHDSYTQALEWIYRSVRFGIKLGLDNAKALNTALSLRGRPRYIFHVAGTNGKGSVCAMLERICRDLGFRTGLYTSPHLVSCRERIQVSGEMISQVAFVHAAHAVRSAAKSCNIEPTFFEILTAMALLHFRDAACDCVILETGMGGRLDATNAITPTVSVITPISMDHQQWLGDTLTAIAREKAGIIKPGVPVVVSPQSPESLDVLRCAAEESKSPLTVVTSRWPGEIALAGEHQQWNAATAWSAIHAAGIKLPQSRCADSLRRVRWPGRLQEIEPNLFLDGAHNPGAAKAIASAWQERFPGRRPILLVAMLGDKDAVPTLAPLAAMAAEAIATSVQNPRSMAGASLAHLLHAANPVLPCQVATDARTALDLARSVGSADRPILVTGSLYLVGEVLALTGNDFIPDPPVPF